MFQTSQLWKHQTPPLLATPRHIGHGKLSGGTVTSTRAATVMWIGYTIDKFLCRDELSDVVVDLS